MGRCLIVLMLSAAPGCTTMDKLLGVPSDPSQPDTSEQTIQSGESALRAVDYALPGAGGALAVLFGLGARAYVKRRKTVPQ